MKLLSTTALVAAALTTTASAADLRMSWWGGDSRHEATQAALEVCSAKHGHTVSPEFTGWSGHLEKVTTQIAGGTEADIMQINWPWLPLFSADGTGFADLNTLSDTIDLSNWTQAQLDGSTMNGALNGLPLSTTGRVMWFNQTTYEKAGLSVPTTWEELMAAGPVFQEVLGEDYYPFEGNGLDAMLIIINVVTQMTGKDMIDPATNTVAWTAEELTAGIEHYGAMVENHVIKSWPMAAADGNVALHENPAWADGHIAGAYQWDSTYFKISDPMNDDQVLVPAGVLTLDGSQTDGVYRKASMVFSISANSENQQAAAEILNCLLNEEEGIAEMGTARGLPASAAASAQLTAAGMIDATQKAANDQVLAAGSPGISPFNEHPAVRDAFTSPLEEFAYSMLGAADAAEIIIEGVNDALSDI